MVAESGRLPEQLGKRRAPHRHRLGSGARRRDVKGLAVGARIGEGVQVLGLRLQILAREQRNLVPARGVDRQAVAVETAVVAGVGQQRIELACLPRPQGLAGQPLAVLHLEQQRQHGRLARARHGGPADARHLALQRVRQRPMRRGIPHRSRPDSCQACCKGESRYSATVRSPRRISATTCMPTVSGYFTPSISSALVSTATSAL